MSVKLRKYWSDILKPVLLGEQPPTIPQAVILQDGKVLLVKRDNPALWELPGGAMLPGETIEDAVTREVKEETGIRTEIVRLLGRYHRTGFRAHQSPVFICRPLDQATDSPAEDVLEVRYFPLSDLPRAMFPWYRPILVTDIRHTAPEPARRTQHLGLWVVLQCVCLDAASRLGLLP